MMKHKEGLKFFENEQDVMGVKMERQSVQSSNIESIGYDNGTLEIEFLTGHIYHYFDVPESEHENLMAATSHGEYLAKNIKGTYEYERIK